MERKHDVRCSALLRRDAMRSAAHGLARAPRAPSDGALRDDWAPVFISYAQRDRAIVRALAGFLSERGIKSWWDREILSGEDFTCAIETALRAARAVIVLWSNASVTKEYVRNEATYARDQGKLITVHVAEFDKNRIPIGFILRQSECVDDRARLIEALARFSIRPREKSRNGTMP